MDKPIALAIQVGLLVIMFALQPTLGPYGILFIGCGLGIMASQLRLAVITSFVAAFSLWVSFAIYADTSQKFYLSKVIADMLALPFPWLSYFVTGLLGAVPCTLIAMTTFLVKSVVMNGDE